ncbi:hypothetical protein [Sandarakinorhabdus sp.]|uniref:hypothetical protein n=1 Tax=Sandarakinorhabdus sp. TaxID=1916663 RepID=UPI00286E7A1E|nr:hypothetical protein [Sandarakinorhabdus sp.]
MLHRLFLLLAAFLVALLPLEATYAANGCTPMATMQAENGECGDCAEQAPAQCQIYCIALCQSLPAAGQSFAIPTDALSIIYAPLLAKFRLVVNEGPEPPPPRISG